VKRLMRSKELHTVNKVFACSGVFPMPGRWQTQV